LRQSIRLVVNALTLVSRMAVTFGIGLYITRLLLDFLGHADFGLLAALGATGNLLMLLTPALNTGAVRNMAYELGRSDPERAIAVFNATLVLFAAMAFAILSVGVLAAAPLLGALQIPEGRESAAAAVYWFALATLVLTTAGTAFRGAVEARQAMGQVAAGEVVRSLLNLACVAAIPLVGGDPLVTYSAAMLAATGLRFAANGLIAAYRFPEVKIRPSAIRWSEVRRLASFTGWATLIRIGSPLHAQAAVILIGIAFSPVVTAAYGIAMRVRGYHSHFSKVLPRVVQPAMTTKEARGQRGYVQDLAFMTSKYSSVGALFFVVPLMIEMEAVLDLWLRDVPPGSAIFTSVTLFWMTIRVLGAGVDQAIFAQGAVRGYGLVTLAVWISSIALCAFWFFVAGLGPMSLVWTYVGATVVHLAVTLGIGAGLVGLSVSRWLRETLIPVAIPAVPATLAALGVHAELPQGWPRILAVTAAYGLVATPFAWRFSVGAKERGALLRGLERRRRRLEGGRRSVVPEPAGGEAPTEP
jgi:O-antigen/teichoic acid export membrane protein